MKLFVIVFIPIVPIQTRIKTQSICPLKFHNEKEEKCLQCKLYINGYKSCPNIRIAHTYTHRHNDDRIKKKKNQNFFRNLFRFKCEFVVSFFCFFSPHWTCTQFLISYNYDIRIGRERQRETERRKKQAKIKLASNKAERCFKVNI